MLNAIKDNPSVTYDEIAEIIGKSRKTVARAIASLKKRGVVVRRGSDKTGRWIL